MGPEFPVGPWEMQNNQGPLEMTNVYEFFYFLSISIHKHTDVCLQDNILKMWR